METLTTHGVKVSVRTKYRPDYSQPVENKYFFAYQITIENQRTDTIQLLRRHWCILDSDASEREVEGEGVIGEQPILEPGESHTYSSWTPLSTPMGKMYGAYLMINTITDEEFLVDVPEFRFIAPFKLN